jgi:hypothetical protein
VFEEQYKVTDAEFLRYYHELFVGGAASKTPKIIKSVGFLSGARLCRKHKISTGSINFFFAKERPRKPEMFHFPF